MSTHLEKCRFFQCLRGSSARLSASRLRAVFVYAPCVLALHLENKYISHTYTRIAEMQMQDDKTSVNMKEREAECAVIGERGTGLESRIPQLDKGIDLMNVPLLFSS